MYLCETGPSLELVPRVPLHTLKLGNMCQAYVLFLDLDEVADKFVAQNEQRRSDLGLGQTPE